MGWIDSSPQNKHWVRYAAYFTPAEVNLMERQLLTILDFDLSFTEDELRARLGPLLPRLDPEYRASVDVERRIRQDAAVEEMRMSYRTREYVEVDAEACLEVPVRAVGAAVASQGRRTTEPAIPAPYAPSTPPTYGKRITPEYERRASSPSPAGAATSRPLPLSHLSAVPMLAQRPPLRSKTSSISLASSRGATSRRNSSCMSDGGLSPRSSNDDVRSAYYSSSSSSASSSAYPSPRRRISRLSSNSSMSTLSSTSSGPQTPCTPYNNDHSSPTRVPPVPSVPPFSLADYTLAPARTLAPPAAAAQTKSRYISPLRPAPPPSVKEEAYVPPTPGLMYAMSHDPDLWPLMSASAVSVKDARGSRQAVRVVA